MQPDPVVSIKMIADHRWDEQGQYELDKYRDRPMELKRNLELVGTEEGLHSRDHLELLCKLQLRRLHGQENLASLQRWWETWEGFENLPQEEIERLFKLQTERYIKEIERHICRTWADRLQPSLGVQGVQDLPDDLPEFRRQIERLRRQTLQHWQHELLCIERAYLHPHNYCLDKFSLVVDTNNVSSSVYTPYSVRKFGLPPKVDNQLEGKQKPIQMLSPDSTNFGDTSDDGQKKSVVPNSIVDMIWTACFLVSVIVFGDAMRILMLVYLVSSIIVFGITVFRTSRKRSYSGPFYTATNKKTCNPRRGEQGFVLHGVQGFVLHSADVRGNRVRKNISVISRAGSGGSSPERTSSTLTGGNNHHRETIALYNDRPEVILDNQAHVHCTGNFNVLSNLNIGRDNLVLIAANGEEMETYMSGSVHMGNFILPADVHYCPKLGNRIIVSGSVLDNDDYGYEFGRGKFTVKDLKNDMTVGEGRLVDNNYILDYLKISGDRTPVPQQPGPVATVWNTICSALHRLGLNP